jgi:hypothetical protein
MGLNQFGPCPVPPELLLHTAQRHQEDKLFAIVQRKFQLFVVRSSREKDLGD